MRLNKNLNMRLGLKLMHQKKIKIPTLDFGKKKIYKDIFGYNGSVCSSYGNYYGWDGPGGAA